MNAGPRELPPSVLATTAGVMAAELTDGTEADPLVVLLHLLAGAGVAMGSAVHSEWTGRRTPARLYVLVIGRTGAGKGLADEIARPVLALAAPDWFEEGIAGGLVSGEGLLAALGGEDKDDDGDLLIPHPFVGQLLVIEPEFGRVLAGGRREGSTLTQIIRDLWDRSDVASLSRNRPLRAKGAHLSIVGHITPRELEDRSDNNMIENGFLNRFLAVDVRIGPPKPFGTGDRGALHERCGLELGRAISSARRRVVVRLDPSARDRWTEMYMELRVEQPGVAGSLATRGIAHVQRLALLLALVDQAATIETKHLDAARDIWSASAAAWAMCFGGSDEDRLSTRLRVAIETAGGDGLSRTQLRHAAGSNNVPAARIDSALLQLEARGLIHRATPPPKPGRPAEVWRAGRDAAARSDGNEGNEGTPESDDVDFAPIPPIFLAPPPRSVRASPYGGGTVTDAWDEGRR